MMIYNLSNVNTNKLHDEFIKEGINPVQVSVSGDESTFKFSNGSDEVLIQSVVDRHIPNSVFIHYDLNGFILNCTYNVFSEPCSDYIFEIEDTLINGLEEGHYEIPTHRYLNGTVTVVEDPNDYIVSPSIWSKYIEMRKNQLSNMLETCTLQEIKSVYQSYSAEDKEMFKQCYMEYWKNLNSTQISWDFTYEYVFKVLLNTLYVKDVLKRELTQEEQDEYNNLLTMFNNLKSTQDSLASLGLLSLEFTNNVLQSNKSLNDSKLIPELEFITSEEE